MLQQNSRFAFQFIITLSIFILIFSCKKKEIEKTWDSGKNYFPFVQGNLIEYEVDSIAFIQLPTVDTIEKKLRIKIILDSMYTDAEGRTCMKIFRYRKDITNISNPDSVNYLLQDVWTCSKTENAVETIEENIPYVKLSFPVIMDRQWNGNAKNTLGFQNYFYQSVHENEISNNMPFDSVTTVSQKFSSSAIAYQNHVEKYAKNVGLIYKEQTEVYSQNVSPQPVLDRIESGVIYRMKIISYAVEVE